MEFSIGRKIYELRRDKGLTQEQLAELMGVSAQAVSKWENDQSCPDITSLPRLARELGVKVDELLGGEPEPLVQVIPAHKRDINKLVMRIKVDSENGDRVRVNLPLVLLKAFMEAGMQIPDIVKTVGEDGANKLSNVDWAQLFSFAESGAVGKFVEVDSDGYHVEITIE